MTATSRDISPDLLRQFLEQTGMSTKQFAKYLNVSEASVFRWLDGTKPTGTSAAVMGLLILNAGISRSKGVKECAARGLALFRLMASLIDPTNESMLDLQHRLGLEYLKELQKEECEIISRELDEAEQEAKEAIEKLHRDQRKVFRESVKREKERLEKRLTEVISVHAQQAEEQ